MADTSRDDNNRLVSMERKESSDEIRGPLGIWPFPILNLIANMMDGGKEDVVITEIRRDEDGRIVSMEEFKL